MDAKKSKEKLKVEEEDAEVHHDPPEPEDSEDSGGEDDDPDTGAGATNSGNMPPKEDITYLNRSYGQRLRFLNDAMAVVNAAIKKDDVVLIDLKSNLQVMQQKWDNLTRVHEKRMAIWFGKEETLPESLTEQDKYDRSQVDFLYVKENAEEKIEELKKKKAQAAGATTSAKAKVKIQEIPIPTFNGKPEEWDKFWVIFKSMVHENDELPTVTKYSYLRQKLVNDAEKATRHYRYDFENYDELVEYLQNRFANGKEKYRRLLNQLFDIQRVDSAKGKALQVLYDELKAIWSGMETLNAGDGNCQIVLDTMEQCLPFEIQQRWYDKCEELYDDDEQLKSNPKKMVETFFQFLARKAKSARLVSHNSQREVKEPKREKRTRLRQGHQPPPRTLPRTPTSTVLQVGVEEEDLHVIGAGRGRGGFRGGKGGFRGKAGPGRGGSSGVQYGGAAKGPKKTPGFHQGKPTPVAKPCYPCIFCGNDHNTHDCRMATKIPVGRRYDLCKRRGLCFLCLHSGHSRKDCKTARACHVNGCQSVFHHPFLHRDGPKPSQ